MRFPAVSLGLALAIVAAACLPGGGVPFRDGDDAGPPPPTGLNDLDAGLTRTDVDVGDPFAIVGVLPSHGGYRGGTRAVLNGRGFASNVRVFIGGAEVDRSAVVASDATRIAVVTPPGKPGPADVRVLDESTAQERTLPGGYYYDAFVLSPSSGSTTGGTRVAIEADGMVFTAQTTAAVDGKPCTDVALAAPGRLECTTPPGSIGPKEVTVSTPGNAPVQARDAFTYIEDEDAARGGFFGGTLAGSMKVTVRNAFTGAAIPGATVIGGESLGSALVVKTDATGTARLEGASGALTVTVAAKCHKPTTFVDVPVDTLSVYLTPVIDLACASLQDPPSTGGVPWHGAQIEGQLIWRDGIEFKRAGWNNVPRPVRSTERYAAYVFLASGSPLIPFSLPPASLAVTPDSPGVQGYRYTQPSAIGNNTVYALAGVEDRSVSPPRFTAYAMGVARGVSVLPGSTVTGVDIIMSTLLDHGVTLNAEPPAPGPRGPDRLVAYLATTLGPNEYALFPTNTKKALLPVQGNLVFGGVPALDGALSGESYVLGAMAVTGTASALPSSVVGRIKTTNADTPVTLSGFLSPPVHAEPGSGTWSGTQVKFSASGTYDLAVLDVDSGSGLVDWTIVAPAGKTAWGVPDLAALPSADPLGLRRGAIQTTLSIARINGFSYAKLRYGHLGTGSWSAYANDRLSGSY